ncbi:MAG: phosphatidylserine decarboxylase family protein [Deltaproteobacteria bacterium]|jgi:phosphatidylserine decarboxylase|nr:phosphatidylserine decarboxylase family protein [Deltaproteobacteria bacterium]
MKEPQIPVAREGYPFIAFFAFATLVVALLEYQLTALVLLFLTGFVAYFFRDPERVLPDAGDAVVSPADGKVILVEKIFDDRFINEHVYKVSIFMSVFDVHVNRLPYAGTVEKIEFVAGSFYAANTEQGGLANEHCALILAGADNLRYAVVQVAGLVARRIVCWAEKGDVLQRGSRFGLIRFGSRVDLYLPQQMQIEVRAGQRVRAGETVIGYIP